MIEILEGTKTCSKCRIEKGNKEFYWYQHKGRKKPHSMSECKECCKSNNLKRKTKENFREQENSRRKLKFQTDELYREQILRNRRNSYFNNLHKSMWYAAKQRSRKYGLQFNIDIEDVVIPVKCPLLDIPLERGTQKVYENSPSLDRIDNTKGYIKGNVQVISKKANSMKNSATLDELKLFSDNMLKFIATYDIVRTTEELKPVELQDKELVS